MSQKPVDRCGGVGDGRRGRTERVRARRRRQRRGRRAGGHGRSALQLATSLDRGEGREIERWPATSVRSQWRETRPTTIRRGQRGMHMRSRAPKHVHVDVRSSTASGRFAQIHQRQRRRGTDRSESALPFDQRTKQKNGERVGLREW